MHPIAVAILIFMLLDFTVGMTADVLNVKKVSTRIPKAFSGWYPAFSGETRIAGPI